MRSGRLQDRSQLAAIKAYACFGSIRAYLHGPPGREIVPYIGFICMCRAKGYVFFSHFGGNRVSISTILVCNRVYSSLELGLFF